MIEFLKPLTTQIRFGGGGVRTKFFYFLIFNSLKNYMVENCFNFFSIEADFIFIPFSKLDFESSKKINNLLFSKN